MSLHESQSLFLEMQIIKTKEFNIFLENLFRKNSINLPYHGKVKIYIIKEIILKKFYKN